MEASWKFSGGVAKANLILSGTRILQRAWEFISQIKQSPRPISFAIRELPRFTILAFNSRSRPQDVLPNLESLVDSHPLSFLITKDNPSVALDSFPLSTFCSLLEHPDLKNKLKTLTSKNQPRLIVVGHAEGGAVAALFTLWLLKNRASAALPICITYGSPFIGNEGLQTAIGKMEHSKSQFWHVLSLDDPVISSCGFPPSENDSADLQFKPFGTYLLLSESGYACIDDPNSVIELLRSADSVQTEPKDYGAMLQQLEQRTKYRKCNVQLTPSYDSLKVDLALQLQTLEIGYNQQGEDDLLQAMEKRHRSEWKKPTNNSKKLNNMKMKMAQLEWFMKFCEKGGCNYYDFYKRSENFGRENVNVGTDIKIFLVDYWEKEVKKVENKPQTQDAQFRDRWLFGGNNYRRMVEPLHIAEYYKKGGTDYLNHREAHFAKLEGWEQADSAKKEKKGAAPMKEEPKGKNAPPNVTHDSCFWARVEEAALKLPELKKGGEAKIRQELREFEDYVMKLVNDYWLSPDAFYEESSFMVWWRRYWEMLQREEPDSDRDSRPFIVFMDKGGYRNYVNSAK
ncbi:hypothetical protein EJ110_NYTH01685 [Nymphaea thermarum]|nr:hypothetical protein EJ110_NYTH01685 [Nymphaea thermarum]